MILIVSSRSNIESLFAGENFGENGIFYLKNMFQILFLRKEEYEIRGALTFRVKQVGKLLWTNFPND